MKNVIVTEPRLGIHLNMILDGNHERFLSHLERSQSAVWLIARLFNQRGYNVTIPAASKADSHQDWKSHADDGDIYINQRVEVKHLGVNFTSSLDWPFSDKFIVCARHAFDRAVPKPFAYVVLSLDTRNAAAVFCSDSHSWTIETRIDSRYNGVLQQEFYFSPIQNVKFFKMPEIMLASKPTQ